MKFEDTSRRINFNRFTVWPWLRASLCMATMLLALPALGQQRPLLTRHLREAVANGQAQMLGRLPATQSMHFDIVLPLRDHAGLETFLSQVQNPASPQFRHFLTPEEFTERFGPSQEDWDGLVAFAKANGFETVSGSRDAMDLRLIGSVANMERAFHVTLGVYQHPTEDRTFFAPDREPTVDLPFQLWHISGLDNYSIPRPLLHNQRDSGEIREIHPDDNDTGSGPNSYYLGSDMRAAYCGEACLFIDGLGQNIALFEFAGYDLADLNTYYTNIGQTRSTPVKGISTDGTSLTCVHSGKNSCDDGEQILDMTQALGMAPGIKALYVYVGSTDTAIISAMTATTDAPLSMQISCSWGWGPADPGTLDPYFEKMASQGQTFFSASGDNSTWTESGAASAWPADDAYVVSVGGTELTTSGPGGSWQSEPAWPDSGGGVSPDSIPIPSWQQIPGVIDSSNEGSATLRNGPDVSANAVGFYQCWNQAGCGHAWGTSASAPMWAGFMALVNEYAVNLGEGTIGFLNPPLYDQIGTSSSYHSDLHDITKIASGGGISVPYPAVAGYDLITGWGSPNGINLIAALALPGSCSYVRPGETLLSGGSINSCDGRFTLDMQASDGNLVLYWNGHGALWASKTQGNPGAYAVMQDDGNLVVYSTQKKALWNSVTFGNPGAFLEVQDDGNLVVYNPGRQPLWNSHTCCH
jgi:subtilase family serine protease